MEAARQSVAIRMTITSPVVISNVPAYLWHNGCGPTAVGMVMGYWDGRGYTALVPGSATSQTAAVTNMISDMGNWNDYCLPMDSSPPLLTDKSGPPRDPTAHTNDCVADFALTSQSAANNCYGWSWFSDVAASMTGYVAYVAPQYQTRVSTKTFSSMTYTQFCGEISSNRPIVLLVDSDGDTTNDHFIAAIGYGMQGSTQMYACLDTWDTSTHWYTFQGMHSGKVFGVYGAIFFSITQGPPAKAISPFPANGATNQDVNVALSWQDGGGAVGFKVYFGTHTTPGAGDYQGAQPDTSYSPGTLAMGCTYYWRIDPTNAVGTTTGTVWSFTTRPPQTYYVSPYGSNISPYASWQNAATDLQDAVNAASDGESVLVTNGVYLLPYQLMVPKNIQINSVNGACATILDGQNNSSCLSISGGRLSGFTIRNGNSSAGGGVYFISTGEVWNCRIQNNTANQGGGIFFSGGGRVCNSEVSGNSGFLGGGAWFNNGGLMENCTVVNNSSLAGGAGVVCSYGGLLLNTIIYFNQPDNWANVDAGWGYTNCCTTPAVDGAGNLTNEPDFEDFCAGDYHLAPDSPCINAGTNFAWMTNSCDVDGEARIMDGVVDIGMDETICLPEADQSCKTNNLIATQWSAVIGGRYMLQLCVNASSQSWQNVSTIATAKDVSITFTDTNSAPVCRFYRTVRLLP